MTRQTIAQQTEAYQEELMVMADAYEEAGHPKTEVIRKASEQDGWFLRYNLWHHGLKELDQHLLCVDEARVALDREKDPDDKPWIHVTIGECRWYLDAKQRYLDKGEWRIRLFANWAKHLRTEAEAWMEFEREHMIRMVTAHGLHATNCDGIQTNEVQAYSRYMLSGGTTEPVHMIDYDRQMGEVMTKLWSYVKTGI